MLCTGGLRLMHLPEFFAQALKTSAAGFGYHKQGLAVVGFAASCHPPCGSEHLTNLMGIFGK